MYNRKTANGSEGIDEHIYMYNNNFHMSSIDVLLKRMF